MKIYGASAGHIHAFDTDGEQKPVRLAAWAIRIAAFSAAVLVCTIPLHRLTPMPTPVALNLFKLGFAGAVIALVLGVISIAIIWNRGSPGIASAIFAIVIGVAILLWPAAYIPVLQSLPAINDVTTDTQAAPPFVTLAKARTPDMNPGFYPGEEFAQQQRAAYGDLRPFLVDRSSQEAFELALDAMRRLKIDVVNEEPPTPGRPGYIEGVDRTLIIGFYDDVVLRIEADGRNSRIDVRSASRYGRHDLGRNAERVRRILKELQARLEANVPSTAADRLARARALRDKAAVPKRLKGGSREKAGSRPGQDRAPPDARRAPVPTGKQL